ncbi:MAG TPA: HEAT repeat domain-containing protein [Actinomycetota bacterium]|nr:HEAT repeat domain-containing protein [Actinomycetota bacterium]
MSRIRSLLRVRPAEGRVAATFVALMLAGMTGAAIGANGVESLFFARFGPEYLPYLYIVLAVVTFGLTVGASGLLSRPDPTRILLGLLAALGGLVLLGRAALMLPGRWIYPVLWVVMMIAWTGQIMATWGLAGAVHDTRQAKRLFPLYGSGLILGAVVGGLLTGPLADALGPENLLVVWAVALGVVVALARSVSARGARRARRRGRRHPITEMARAAGVVTRSPLLLPMAVSLTLFAVLYFSLALVFAESATARYPRAADLAGFLGLFMGLSNAAALAISLLVANRLFARFGVASMVGALPLIYLVGFAAMAVTDPFPGLVGFRFVQMVWVNGIWATGWQALFNVVPSEDRAAVRAFMDGGPLQAGVLLSGVLLLLAQGVLSARGLYVAGAVAAAAAAATMWRARRGYRMAVREALRAGNPDVFRTEDRPFAGVQTDAEATRALVAAAGGPDPVARRIAVEILAEEPVPDAAGVFRGALREEDPGVRAAAVRGLAASGADADDFVASLRDPDPAVRAAAAAALHDRSDDRGREALAEMARSPDPTVRATALPALAAMKGGTAVVLEALADPDPAVREAAATALATTDEGPGQLLRALKDPVTEDAALVGLGRARAVEPGSLLGYAARHAAAATRDHERWRRLDPSDVRLVLLAHALRHRVIVHATRALRAVAAASGSDDIDLVVENLDSADPQQRANALEMLESAGAGELVRPLASVWETMPASGADWAEVVRELLGDEDPWIRSCARYATDGEVTVETLTTISLMDRMVFLRRVGLFADLSPADLKHVAEAATEHAYSKGHMLAEEGEPGEELHLVVEGEIAVRIGDEEVARRGPGEYVGEMALLDQQPRMASLVAAAETRTVSIDRRRFQRILRERPTVSLAVMQVLSQRLREAHASRPAGDRL